MREAILDIPKAQQGELLVELKRETTQIEIWEDNDRDKPFILWWTDYVANDWEERFETLTLATLRLTALLVCEENEWNKGFIHNNEDFIRMSKTLLDNLAG